MSERGENELNDKEMRYSKELERCQSNIQKTKGLIEYHKDMLKKLEKKEAAISSKLSKIKMADFCEVIQKSGYDIDILRNAVATGDFNEFQAKLNEECLPTEKAEPQVKINDTERKEEL